MFTPDPNSMPMNTEPSLARDHAASIPATVPSSSSTGCTTCSSVSCGLAFGYGIHTPRKPGSKPSGIIWTGIRSQAMNPTTSIATNSISTLTGRS